MKAQNNVVKIKLHRNTTPDKSDTNEIKMSLFDNLDTEEFLLFQKNYKMTFEVLLTLTAGPKIQYLHTFLPGKALCDFGILCARIGNMTTTRLNHILLILCTFTPN